MQAGTYLTNIDYATVAIYSFWIFFAGLVLYLNRESKREGYPLITPGKPLQTNVGFIPGMPEPKTFLLANGTTVQAPKPEVERQIAMVPMDPWPGSPMIPTGDPMVDGVGPAAYVMRGMHPAVLHDDGTPSIVPLRLAPEFNVDGKDPDPRGYDVLDADGVVAGKCVDVWLDKSEMIFRYIEVAVGQGGWTRTMMIPVPLIRVDGDRRVVKVRTLLAKHFMNAPTLSYRDSITLREEDMVSAYCAGGQLYAKPERSEPFL
ncbi:photosynthetic reaction center subunit H [Sediminicoccus sp. KRV36]|uniref:photosynthetic reaction center subunit H n=1 Tax=Sediminicoccus sp. KRV36 TaxID=3133721 RepID=UPI00200CB28B|nr:photosynthetic reaction center subunit H [Sediminicoccus rosea]UPY35329.1 photosynthetic reaction center subunit H [Sediminicoccus rosea]